MRIRPTRLGILQATTAAAAVGVLTIALARPDAPAVTSAEASGAAFVAAPAPVPGTADLELRSISAGGPNTCGLAADGRAFCWGHDGFGQLGTGRFTQNMTRPERVETGPWKQVASGFTSTCALAADGRAFCWGSDSFGALGTGELRRACNGTAQWNSGCSPEPLPVAGGLRFASIVSGGGNDRTTRQMYPSHHTCALTAEGEAWCWGSNHNGELGTGRQYPLENPAPLRVATDLRFTELTAGYHFTCGLTAEGKAYCWGASYAGEIGDGTPAQGVRTSVLAAAPREVKGGLRFEQIDAGDWHTCGVTEGGEVYCWGLNERAQLGTRARLQDCEPDPKVDLPCSPVPVRADTDRRFTRVTLGEDHTCALTADGEVYCWGELRTAGAGERAGSLEACPVVPVGDLSDTSGCVPVPTRTATSQRFTAVDAGRVHTCALGRDGAAYCWGWGAFGMGFGVGTGSFEPREVASPRS